MRLQDYTVYTYQTGDYVFGYRPGLPPGALFDPSEFVPGSAENFGNADLIANASHNHNGSGYNVSLSNYSLFEFTSTSSLSSEQAYVVATSIGEAFSIYGDKHAVFGGQVSIGTPFLTAFMQELNGNAGNALYVGNSSVGVYVPGAGNIAGYFEGTNFGVDCYSSGTGKALRASANITAIHSNGTVHIESYGFAGTKSMSAVLQLDSTTQGFLLPRMTTAEINAIPSPSNGLLVYSTTLGCPCFYDGTGWRKVSHSAM